MVISGSLTLPDFFVLTTEPLYFSNQLMIDRKFVIQTEHLISFIEAFTFLLLEYFVGTAPILGNKANTRCSVSGCLSNSSDRVEPAASWAQFKHTCNLRHRQILNTGLQRIIAYKAIKSRSKQIFVRKVVGLLYRLRSHENTGVARVGGFG